MKLLFQRWQTCDVSVCRRCLSDIGGIHDQGKFQPFNIAIIRQASTAVDTQLACKREFDCQIASSDAGIGCAIPYPCPSSQPISSKTL